MFSLRALSIILAGLHLSQEVQAVHVYLNPQPASPHVSPQHASFALSRHLGLEFFESLGGSYAYQEETFVGQGSKNGLLLAIDEVDAKDFLPSDMKPSFTVPTLSSPPASLISTYISRAQHAYSSVYSAEVSSSPSGPTRLLDLFSVLPETPATTQFISELQSLSSFLDSAPSSDSSFAAVEMAGLTKLRLALGTSSEEYKLASEATKSVIASALSQSDKINLALLTFSPHQVLRRQPQQSQTPLPPYHPTPQEPISSISTCFATADACTNGTSTCSGRGECVQASKAGRTCFVCACGTTKTGEGNNVKTEIWVGEKCERKDISGPFVLLTGTVIAMILLLVGSVSLLYGVGDQPLPSTLLGGAVGAHKE